MEAVRESPTLPVTGQGFNNKEQIDVCLKSEHEEPQLHVAATQSRVIKHDRHALLLGSPFGELTGVFNDIETMKRRLADMDFQIYECSGEQATRKGIIAAWQQLIDKSEENGVVVVYYSGRGGIAQLSTEKGQEHPHQPWRFQFIVPMDFNETVDTDFRGIADAELSYLLRKLTDKTRNVTIILDCCHAARMARVPDLKSKALSKTWDLGITRHVQKLRDEGKLEGFTSLLANPYAVRVFAAATTESAYEHTNSDNKRIGVLTEALDMALEAIGKTQSVSWISVMHHVCTRVGLIMSQQHPRVEGPATRVTFGLEEVNLEGVLKVTESDGYHAQLNGGLIAGVQEGDVYAVMPSGEEIINSEKQIATATVQNLGSANAKVKLVYGDQHTCIPPGSLAFPLRKGILRWAVRIDGDTPVTQRLRSLLNTSKLVKLVHDEDTYPPLMTARHIGNAVALLDSQQIRLFEWRVADNTSPDRIVKEIVDRVEILARAQHLLQLKPGTGQYALGSRLSVEWGVVAAGERTRLEPHGEILHEGQNIYILLSNDSTRTVYVSIFDIGVSGSVTALSHDMGIEIPAKGTYILGADEFNNAKVLGLPLGWPDTVLRDITGNEGIVIITTSKPIDLTSLETSSIGTRRSPAPRALDVPEAELFQVVDQASFGGVREIPKPRPDALRYDVQHIRFVLTPNGL